MKFEFPMTITSIARSMLSALTLYAPFLHRDPAADWARASNSTHWPLWLTATQSTVSTNSLRESWELVSVACWEWTQFSPNTVWRTCCHWSLTTQMKVARVQIKACSASKPAKFVSTNSSFFLVCIRWWRVNTTVLPPSYHTSTRIGTMKHFSKRPDALTSPSFNTSHTMNSCRSF